MHQTSLELLNSQDQYEFEKISTIKPNDLIVQNVTKKKKFHCTRSIHSALVYCHSYCVWRCSNTKRVCVWFQKVEKRQFREISRNENPNETKREKTIKKTISGNARLN